MKFLCSMVLAMAFFSLFACSDKSNLSEEFHRGMYEAGGMYNDLESDAPIPPPADTHQASYDQYKQEREQLVGGAATLNDDHGGKNQENTQ